MFYQLYISFRQNIFQYIHNYVQHENSIFFVSILKSRRLRKVGVRIYTCILAICTNKWHELHGIWYFIPSTYYYCVYIFYTINSPADVGFILEYPEYIYIFIYRYIYLLDYKDHEKYVHLNCICNVKN